MDEINCTSLYSVHRELMGKGNPRVVYSDTFLNAVLEVSGGLLFEGELWNSEIDNFIWFENSLHSLEKEPIAESESMYLARMKFQDLRDSIIVRYYND